MQRPKKRKQSCVPWTLKSVDGWAVGVGCLEFSPKTSLFIDTSLIWVDWVGSHQKLLNYRINKTISSWSCHFLVVKHVHSHNCNQPFRSLSQPWGLLSYRNCSNDCGPGGFLDEVGMVWSLCGTFKATSWEWGLGMQQRKWKELTFLVWTYFFLKVYFSGFGGWSIECASILMTAMDSTSVNVPSHDQVLWCEDLLHWVNLDPAEAQVSVRWGGNRGVSFRLESRGPPKLPKTLIPWVIPSQDASHHQHYQIISRPFLWTFTFQCYKLIFLYCWFWVGCMLLTGGLQDRSIHLCNSTAKW